MKALGRLVAAGGSVALLLSGMVATSAEAAGNLTAAPYYVPLDNDPQDIGDAITASGQKSFILPSCLRRMAAGAPRPGMATHSSRSAATPRSRPRSRRVRIPSGARLVEIAKAQVQCLFREALDLFCV